MITAVKFSTATRIRCTTVVSFLAGLVLLSQVAFANVNPDIPRIDAPVTVDGNLSEAAWQQAAQISVPLRLYQTPVEPHDLSATAKVFWSERGLHVGVTVTDNVLLFAETTRQMAEHDSVEVWLGHFWIQVSPTPAGGTLKNVSFVREFPPLDLTIEAAAVAGENGYTVEILVPARTFTSTTGAELRSGSTFRLGLSVRDRDDANTRARGPLYYPARMGWNAPNSQALATLR